MELYLDAACQCDLGRSRKHNEDNFFFDGRCLPEENSGLRHPVLLRTALQKELCVAVFDGIGGTSNGESAAFAAADCVKSEMRRLEDFVVPEKRFLRDLCARANAAVVARARELKTAYMGTTMAALYFAGDNVYVCNLGDSRAYRLRDGEFLQLSHDHVELGRETEGKPALTQYLGIDAEEFLVEPYIAKGELKAGDQYLLCSDGLTDMLTNAEIDGLMEHIADTAACVQALVDAALKKGGRDNVTVILCRISDKP